MASDVLATLDLDKDSLSGKIFLIKEMSGSEAHFVNSCLIAKQLKEQGAVCLVTLHNSFQHYNSVGLKLGYNLDTLKEVDTVKSVDVLSLACDGLNTDKDINNLTVDILFKLIEESITSLIARHSSVCLIIDDLTGLLEYGFTLIQVNMFVQLCKSFILKREKCSLIAGVHVISETDQSAILSGLISHMADVICEVSGFKTGRSRDVSGILTVTRPWSNESNNLIKLNNYHYKLFDRGIKVFAPGSK